MRNSGMMAALALIFFSGCGGMLPPPSNSGAGASSAPGASGNPNPNEGGEPADNVVNVDEDDPEMNLAIAKARASVRTFITAMQAPKPSQSSFGLKKPCVDGDKVEHFWLIDVKYDGEKFSGIIDNDPVMVSNIKIGDKVTVLPTEISDWMFVEDGRLVGGESIRLLLKRMSPAERESLIQGFGFTVD